MGLSQTITTTNKQNGVTTYTFAEFNRSDTFDFEVSIDSNRVYDTRWISELAIKIDDIDIFHLYDENNKTYFGIHFYDNDNFEALEFLNNLKSDKELKEITLHYIKMNNKRESIFELYYHDFDGVEDIRYNVKNNSDHQLEDGDKYLTLRFNKVELIYTNKLNKD